MAIPQLVTLAVGLGIAGFFLWLVHRQSRRFTPAHSYSRDWMGEGTDQCVVCMDRNTCVVLLPCGHSDLCEQCTKRIMRQDKRCPICRRVIDDFEVTFAS